MIYQEKNHNVMHIYCFEGETERARNIRAILTYKCSSWTLVFWNYIYRLCNRNCEL